MKSGLVALLACVVAAGCSIEHDLVPCGDLYCPHASVCTASGVCADKEAAAACTDKVDGDRCMTMAIADGTCAGGACHVVTCGNAIVDHDEACDDGNQTPGDGCSGDCRSNETCNNGVADILLGEACDSGLYGVSGDGCAADCTMEVEIWREVTPQGLTPRVSTAVAFDSDRGRLVLYGGSQTGALDETWEWDRSNWLRMTPGRSPSPRSAVALAFDPVSHRTIMFGGKPIAGSGPSDETWSWDGIAWTLLAPASSPSARFGAVVAFDSARGVLVLYGGNNGAQLGDTWEWNGTTMTWTLATPSSLLGARANTAVAYDDNLNAVILYAGGTSTGETWQWTGTTWTKLSGAVPTPRSGFAIAGDPISKRVVLFGGITGVTPLADTWAWNGIQWTQLSPTASAPTRAFHAMAFDPVLGRIVLVAGKYLNTQLSDTWSLDGVSWVAHPPEQPAYRHDHLAVYDRLRGRIILNGGAYLGFSSRSDQWQWDGRNWIRDVAPAMPARTAHAGAYDAAHAMIVAFGGQLGGQDMDETWLWNGTWQQASPPSAPARRSWTAMAYDAAREKVVLFGGGGILPDGSAYHYYGDTWVWDGTRWTDVTPAVSPSPRREHILVYDPVRERVVMHGGIQDNVALDDTWEWDGASWTQVASTGPAVFDHAADYDPLRHVVVFWGGKINNLLSDQTWEWDGATWKRGIPLDRPTSRDAMDVTYHATSRRLVMSGGTPIQAPVTIDTWARSFESPTIPPERCLVATEDTDGDGLAGCADPDCFARCSPLCMPGAPCPANAPRCGDAACGAVEDYLICPIDCPAP